ncbi:Uncharacterized protein OS=Clostridium pasteurianum NRRL B-598 GN=X276_07420 PE=4 SV=1: SnoaL_2 [Gemmata massiliana]|uniref:SnoaL-like domain-containing protein n=1 Tax=Gemmata massiliana TaxID=1210884 RepID=A0A6P2DLT6_9BACT|nr:nuclear transport factor 2 family protein [Gemmata massiliana]VTS01657.1 Uncharacterized protein OS=Clostridium pasteurianum NRRL B-598 GN=X276_07420 PE=4 SV=1: SnoaL_2 [Gemmata massiliana]
MTAQLPSTAAAFLRTVNEHAPAGFITLFTEDAVVDDAGREIRGREAIREWAAHDIFAANVTFEVHNVSGTDGDATITTRVDGTFDRTGLPDPLIMTFRVVGERGKVSGLTCRLPG